MRFVLRQVEVPILPQGAEVLRVLHFSDLHLTPNRIKTVNFIKSWTDLKPDLIISTGDHIAHQDSIPVLLQALTPLQGIPSFYVFGSNDYFAPSFKNPLRYLLPDRGKRIHGPALPWESLDLGLNKLGWTKLHDAKVTISLKGTSIELRGTDDAHLERDRYETVTGPRQSVDLSIGVTHAPYLRIISAMANDNLDLILAGHTHGGQIRIPWLGGTRSLTTNCDLPNWRSRGLTKVQGEPFLHVSAGLGHNPKTPFRFLSPPECTLLTLRSRGNTQAKS